MEQSLVRFGRTEIPYSIRRGRREKTVAVGVDPVDGVLVRAPAAMPVVELDEIVHRKARWILERRRRVEDLPPEPSPREFVGGETFRYLGRQYRLRLDKRGDRVRLKHGKLHVPAPQRAAATTVRAQLVSWYRDHAEARLPNLVATWAEKLGLMPRAVLIRDQRKRWGSVDASRNVRLNWRIIQAPAPLVDYVVVHELVHLRYEKHTRGFWASVGTAISDYESRRERLRHMGREMVW